MTHPTAERRRAIRKDALKLLHQIVAPCDGKPDGWRKCKRCQAIHGLEMRFDLSMRVLQSAIDSLAELDAAEATAEALRAALVAARDVLVSFQKQAGAVEGGYSTRMTDAEMKLAQAVADIAALLAAEPERKEA